LLSFGHVSWPNSPGPGTVLNCHSGLPSFARNAFTRPRLAISPPENPVITMPS
jgi:hypothetical protein